ncbi:unnamed protein product [Rotaria socialis]|uniref:GOST seven transmembrane domain-containing protein n=1 Tax=Rotaria socialis TaxID=392032 RepID=A0A817ULA0_9BILA|nr:unnamed protein product [Rotaria socialis]CAF3424610.1 unnamed protein product [Rotaria socialis]CAF3590284.1 unnamed protein product [Rotaria socialis]CAF3640873.1 unnamed protein product [Rotaria socialis]CAF3726018.1 unnamed protein product [Rotaria socialis]
MKSYFLVYLLFFCLVNYSSATLVDSIVTLSWSSRGISPVVDRFLTGDTQIALKLFCPESSTNLNETQGQMRKPSDKDHEKTKIKITGRIGRVVGCLPLQSDTLMTTNQLSSKDNKESRGMSEEVYSNLWKQMEIREFIMQETNCDDSGALYVDQYKNITGPEISPEKRKTMLKQEREQLTANQKNYIPPRRRRRAAEKTNIKLTNKQSSTAPVDNQRSEKRLQTWTDGYYLIEIYRPAILDSDLTGLDVDVIVSMKNRHGGYITADEYPALVFYGIMCGIYGLFAILWFVWCALYWRELLKIQFWIGGVILIGMIEKSAFLAEYDTVNRHGYKVHVAIVTAEVLSCLKRTVSRMLVIIVALGYGVVKPRLGPLKQKVFAMGLLYFAIATTEAILRLNTTNDETNNKVLISRIPLAVIDATIYYWIFTGLVTTTRTLRLRKNIVKLNVYRHFTNTLIFAILASLVFMIWSLKSHFFTTCITNWREFWVDDAFWHILFSLVLLVIMFLFRPSNNNQRYAFVPLLDQSDNDNDDFDDDADQGETAVFDSITMRKATNIENGAASKSKRQQQASMNREANVSSSGAAGSNGNDAIEDALTWAEDNIPTSIADQALQALDSEDEIVNTKLERSKMQ